MAGNTLRRVTVEDLVLALDILKRDEGVGVCFETKDEMHDYEDSVHHLIKLSRILTGVVTDGDIDETDGAAHV